MRIDETTQARFLKLDEGVLQGLPYKKRQKPGDLTHSDRSQSFSILTTEKKLMLNVLPDRLAQIPRRHLLVIAAGTATLLLILIFGRGGAVPDGDIVGLGGQSLGVLALLAFVGGVVSFVSPCTLPILPAYFAFASQSGRSRIALNTVAFMLGVATMFSLLGASASAVGRLFGQNQELLLLFGGSIVMVFGVMSLLGKGFTGLSSKGNACPGSTTAGGSYIFGLTFSLG